MPAKTSLFSPTPCANVGFLESLLAVLQVRNFLTRNQTIAIRNACAHVLPATIELRQRTPKGTTYLYINGALTHVINTRSRTKQKTV